MNWFIKVLKQFSDFNGRARRKEYWMFTLFNMIFYYALIFLSYAVMGKSMKAGSIPWLPMIYILITLVPSIAVTVRRMHDVGKSGWYCLIPIYNFILTVTEGDMGDNEYGSDPKNEDLDHGGNTLDSHLTN